MHGTNAYYTYAKCRCDECKKAHREYMARWRAGKEIWCDPTRARETIELLLIDGYTMRQIAEEAEVSLATISRIIYERPEHIYYSTHKKIVRLNKWTGQE